MDSKTTENHTTAQTVASSLDKKKHLDKTKHSEKTQTIEEFKKTQKNEITKKPIWTLEALLIVERIRPSESKVLTVPTKGAVLHLMDSCEKHDKKTPKIVVSSASKSANSALNVSDELNTSREKHFPIKTHRRPHRIVQGKNSEAPSP